MSRSTWRVPARGVRAFALGLLTALVLFGYDLLETPIVGDRALFVYLGQAVLRGDSVYSVSLFNYLPLGPLIGGGAMWIGAWFGVPSYLAPRLLSAVIVIISVELTAKCTARATGRAWAGVLAAIVLLSISLLFRLATTGLEPKILVLFFGLISCYAFQRRRWLLLGLASSLGATCWQPFAAIACVYLLQTAWAGRRSLLSTVGKFALGVGLGLLPVVIYLTLVDAGGACWRTTVVMLARARLGGGSENLSLWITWLMRLAESGFVVAAGLGVLWFGARTVSKGLGRALRTCLSIRMGGLPLVTLVWALWTSFSFDFLPDFLPFLWVLGFWTAWLTYRVAVSIQALSGSRAKRKWSGAFVGLALASTAFYGLHDVPRYASMTTLSEQAEMARGILERAGPDVTLACISAEEFYVMDGLRSPLPFLRLKVGSQELSDELIELVTGLEGCRAISETIQGLRPVVFITNHTDVRFSTCVGRIITMLKNSGYERQKLRITEPGLTDYEGRDGRMRTKTFHVYYPPR